MTASLIALIFLCICSILLGATVPPPSPIKWVVIVCATIALILVVAGGLNVQIGGPATR